MKMKAISVAICVFCLIGLCLNTVASAVPIYIILTPSPVSVHEVVYHSGSSSIPDPLNPEMEFDWKLYYPVYAAPGEQVNFTWNFTVSIGSVHFSSLSMLVMYTRTDMVPDQCYSGVLLQGTYSSGSVTTITPAFTVPSNCMIGDILEVAIYSTVNNAWYLGATQVENLNYNDLQNAYNGTLNQIAVKDTQILALNMRILGMTSEENTLNQQIANLTSEENTLNQQIANLTSEENTLNQQIANLTSEENTLNQTITTLNEQNANLTLQNSKLKADSNNNNTLQTLGIPLGLGAVAVVAVLVAIYMFIAKRKITPPKPPEPQQT